MPDLGAIIQTYYNPLVQRMRNLPKPIVCAVNGLQQGRV
jgi:2-(1,2-epoxy-1,2-dihydrophenyl)acetyl-CoA isomerase